jgi:hypothetical protein
MKNTIIASIAVIALLVRCDIARAQEPDHHESDMIMLKARADSAARLRELQTKYVYLKYGDATGDLYVRCQEDPPKRAANQARCQALMARIKKDQAKEDLAQAKAKEKW